MITVEIVHSLPHLSSNRRSRYIFHTQMCRFHGPGAVEGHVFPESNVFLDAGAGGDDLEELWFESCTAEEETVDVRTLDELVAVGAIHKA